ncbi:hypothetical protein [Brevundimonas sp. FT23028]|uniref:hypothetical protein n=1 Tax=Brevundimonas sp. FT23028 TaxID=3393748 RepID=UPI003B589260
MRVLVALLTLATAVPVVGISTTADAQVLTGRGSPRASSRPRAQPPRLSPAEQQQLWDAQDTVADLNGQIEAIQEQGAAAGGLSAAQRAQIASHTTRRNEAQATVDRLVAKRGA